MDNYRFAPMREEDLPEATAIYNYYVENSTATFHMHSLSLGKMKKLAFYENDKYGSYTIWKDNVLTGYCILEPYSPREAYDGTAEVAIYLKQGCHRKGTGGAALDLLEKTAKTKGIHVLISLICSENENSIKLFESRGFIRCGRIKEAGKKFGRYLDLDIYQKILA